MRISLSASSVALGLVLAMAACTEFPDLDGTVTPAVADLPPPALVPLGPLVARATLADRGADLRPTALAPRIAQLRARAAGLRGPVIAPALRARMLRGPR